MSSEKKNWLSVLAFFIVLALVLVLLSAILNVKSVQTWPSSKVVCGFYEEPENTLDVLYLGTSHIMCGCSPMRVWENHGITGYSIATERQYMGLTYYWAKEAFKYQSPKLVVLDAMTIFAWPFSDFESRQRKALDYMKMSDVKLDAIKAICEYNEDADPLTYIIPFIAYHDRWSMLNDYDFTFPFSDKKFVSKGFYICYEGIGVKFPDPFMPRTGTRGDLSKVTMDYFYMLTQLCEENNAKLLLVQLPRSIEWSVEKDETVRSLAKEYGFDFVDLNTPEMLEEIGFDPPKDMFDPWHVSSYGADKVTKYLGDYIAENYKFAPHSQEVIDAWNADDVVFRQLVEADPKARLKARQELEDAMNQAAQEAAREDLED